MRATTRMDVRGNSRAELEAEAHKQASVFFGPGVAYTLGDYSSGKSYDNIHALYASITATETVSRNGSGPSGLTCGRCGMFFPLTHSHYCSDASSHTYPK